MPYKDPEQRRIKAKEYQAVHRLRAKQKLANILKEARFCKLCQTDITSKRKDAMFCCREHKRIFSDRQRDHAVEYAKNKEKRRAQALLYYHANPEKARVRMLNAQKRNLHIFAANAAKRRSAKIQRTPIWLTADDVWMIKQAYSLASLRSKMLGFKWHVDHIVPLQGELVSGLHVPWNLQVIPAVLNIAKHNRFEVA